MLKRLIDIKSLILLGAGFLITLFSLLSYIFKPDIIRFLDLKYYDTLMSNFHAGRTSGFISIVDIDEASLADNGQWPWPRYRIALLLEKIKRLGAVAIGVDIMFSEPDRTSPKHLKESLLKDLNVDIDFTGLPPGLDDNDRILANIMAQGPFVQGYSYLFDGHGKQKVCSLNRPNIAVIKPADNRDISSPYIKAPDIACNIRVIMESTERNGFFNTLPDRDGIYRRVPLVMQFRDELYTSLAVSTMMEGLDIEQLVLKLNKTGVDSLKIGPYVVPLDKQGALMVNFRGSHKTFPYVSAGDILNNKVRPGALSEKIVFLGTSAMGLKDLRSTPLDTGFVGVEVHATVVDNILAGDYITRPGWASGLELLILIVSGIIATCMMTWTRASLSLYITVLTGISIIYGSVWLFDQKGFYLSPIMPVLSLIFLFAFLNLIKFWKEELEKRFFKQAFSRYVSQSVFNEIISNPGNLSLEGEEREVTVMFSDIRGFTAISEKIDPSQVSGLLQAYFTPMTDVVTKYNGTLDKFVGDAIMAFWNAPLHMQDHKEKAVRTALDMLTELAIMNPDLKVEYGQSLRIGVGLHSGNVRVGNMGSRDLFDYTIIGDTVNLTSRLESLTKTYGVSILLSESVYESCKEKFLFQEIDRVQVRGREQPVTIYTVYNGNEEEIDRELKDWDEAYALFKNHDFPESLRLFERMIRIYGNKQLYTLYRDRSVRQ